MSILTPTSSLGLYLFMLMTVFGFSDLAMGQTPISGVVNNYASVYKFAGNNEIIVDDLSGFGLNDRVLIIQMQGATIDETNTSSFGTITDTGSAGLYEFNTICSISGDTLTMKYEFSNSYSIAGKTQVVGVPQYSNASINGTLTADPWNDSTGGIIAIEVSGTLSLSSDIDASGQGFTGGAYNISTANCAWYGNYPDYFYPLNNGNGLCKGHGIASYITSKECGQGPQGNGGGGGNNHNSGGGGGANLGEGGRGGENQDPGTFNCHGYYPGLGGYPLSPSSNRWNFGGGGGCGHGNNSDPGSVSSGGNGGGIIFISADSLVGNGYQITAAGAAGGYALNDGAGGGGAGGLAILDINKFHSSGLTIDVAGGDGGDADNDGIDRCYGPGGGGGGGIVFSTSPLPVQVSINVQGGTAGATINSTECSGSLGATNGGNGSNSSGISITESSVTGNGCAVLLPIEGLQLWITKEDNRQFLQWKFEDQQVASYFIVEYQNKQGQIQELGKVHYQKAIETVYQFALPPIAPGQYYVRLLTVDENKTQDYSRWVSWKVLGNPDICHISPNLISPFEFATIDWTGIDAAKISIEVFDEMGRRTQALTSTSSKTQQINIPNPGWYYVRISDGINTCQKKVLVRP